MGTLRVKLLGGNDLIGPSGDTISLPTRKSQALLIYLIANAGRDIAREEAAHLLWDRSGDEQARASLRQELASLRKALAQVDWDPIQPSKESLRFADAAAAIDVVEFEVCASAGDKASLQRAANLYAGEFAKGLSVRAQPFEDWLSAERRRYEDLATESLIQLLDMAASGDTSICVEDVAKQLLSIDQTNERAHRDLMRTHFQNGRRAEALREFKRCQAVLAKELDTSPSAETLQLLREIQATEEMPDLQIGDSAGANVLPQVEDQASQTAPGVQALPAAVAQLQGSTLAAARSRSKLPLFVSILAAILAVPTAIGGVQYLSDDNKISRDNILCAIPFLQAGDDETIAIGGITPFEKSFGQRQKWGIERFLRDNRNNYPFKVDVDIRDSKGDLEQLDAILRDFEADRPAAIIGPMQSRLAYDAKRWGNQHKIPIVSSLASASYLTVPGERDYFFRVGMSDSTRARAMVDWLQAKNLHNNPYVLHEWAEPKSGVDEPEIYGASQATAAKRHLGQASTLRFLRGDEESQLAAIDQIKNDGRAVLIFGYTSNIKFIIGEMQARGLQNDIFLTGVITEELEKPNYPFPERIHVVTGIVSEASNLSSSAKLRQIFEDDNPGLDYDLSAYYAYDAMHMIMDAVEQARNETCSGRISGESVARFLRETPTKRRKVIFGGFLADTQEVFFNSDGLKLFNGKFRHVGLTNDGEKNNVQ